MAVLAQSEPGEIALLMDTLGELPAHVELRKPESGLVMLRGRIGGDGAPFNVGEATMSRAALRLATQEIGFGYALGRDHDKVRLIALCDALIQTRNFRDAVEMRIVAPIRARLEEARRLADARAAATRVDFFTLVRGEDET